MRRPLPALNLSLVLLCAPAASLHAADALKSPECGEAIATLEEARAAGPGARAQVERLRSEAARVCLGAAAGPATGRPAPVTAPALQVRPPSVAASPLPPVAVTPPVAPPAPAWRPPPVVTACDAGGCWDSEGTRLNRSGPLLNGPRGACSLQGAVLSCP